MSHSDAPSSSGELRVLVVDADDAAAGALVRVLEAIGHHGRSARSAEAALDVAAAWHPAVVLVDEGLPGAGALDFMGRLRSHAPASHCVLLVGADRGTTLDAAVHEAADAWVVKPPQVGDLRRVIERPPAAGAPVETASAVHRVSEIVGDSPAMLEVYRLITLAAPSSASILVTGETGTGKELVSRALHRLSSRRDGPFVAVSCAALPETLIESELFGHEKGAFTGATSTRQGRFELADGGTLFLDEIGELPPSTQVKLLRVLQERTFERLGGTRTLRVDVRIVAATNRDLHEEVQARRFRADLFYRLNVLTIQVPPLRERKSDIPRLWEHFTATAAARDGRPSVKTSTSALAHLLTHDWPGNVRELENVAHHAVTMSGGEMIGERHLPRQLLQSTPSAAAPAAHAGETLKLPGMTMKEIERQAILQTYEATGSNAQATADLLGISVRKVRYRLKEYREEGWLPPRPESHPEGDVERRPGADLDLQRPRLLLAEDDDEVRWSLTALLEQEGYDVVAVPHGQALLEHLGSSFLLERRQAPPDAIITDIRMPGINGLQVLEGVRANGWTTPVILITAFGDDETRKRAEHLGATAFLDKPLDLARLQEVLHRQVPPPM